MARWKMAVWLNGWCASEGMRVPSRAFMVKASEGGMKPRVSWGVRWWKGLVEVVLG